MASALKIRQTDGPETVLEQAPHRVGQVALVVHDLDRVSGFYQSVLGLQVLERGSNVVRLGTGSSPLLELRRETAARRRRTGEAGLYHTAFLLPERADLGAWLSFAIDERVPLTGAADHLVSEAVYLNDPEGNGIEIYADRPRSAWRHRGGMVEMATERLDADGLVRGAAGRSWSQFPEAGTIGHVHLQLGDIAHADSFYGELLGLDVMARLAGASFYGSGGYHHQLAGNVWHSRGAPLRTEPATGLADVELIVDEEILEAVRSNPRAEDYLAGPTRISLRDPWGTSITLRSS